MVTPMKLAYIPPARSLLVHVHKEIRGYRVLVEVGDTKPCKELPRSQKVFLHHKFLFKRKEHAERVRLHFRTISTLYGLPLEMFSWNPFHMRYVLGVAGETPNVREEFSRRFPAALCQEPVLPCHTTSSKILSLKRVNGFVTVTRPSQREKNPTPTKNGFRPSLRMWNRT